MQVYKIDPLRDPRWIELVQKHPQASVFHTRQWLDSIQQTYGYRPVVFTTSAPTGELRNGLVFCRIRSWLTGSRMVSLPFSDHCQPLIDSTEELSFIGNCLLADMEHRDWAYLELRPINGEFEGRGAQVGFCPGSAYYLHRLDLRPSLDVIFRNLDKDSAQRRIMRAQKADIAFRRGRSEEISKDFYKLLVLTRGRHHLPPQPYLWFRNLIRYLGQALDIRVAYKDALPIAGILTLRFRNTTYYKYGCSDARFHYLGAMPSLLWETIQESKASGSEELDLGRSDCQNKGLIAFKDHWAKEHTKLVYWRYPASGGEFLMKGWKLRLARRVFACMPNRLLALTGRLVYRHIG